MEFKGTKGNWSSDGDGKHRMCIDVRFGDTGIKTIATIHTNGTIEEVKANALLISKAPEMLEMLKEAKSMIAVLKRSMLAHPDCELGSEFCDYTTNAQNLEDEIEQLIKEATEI